MYPYMTCMMYECVYNIQHVSNVNLCVLFFYYLYTYITGTCAHTCMYMVVPGRDAHQEAFWGKKINISFFKTKKLNIHLICNSHLTYC